MLSNVVESAAALIHSDVDTPIALNARRLQASSVNTSSDCRCTHPEASCGFLHREEELVVLCPLAFEIDVAAHLFSSVRVARPTP